MPCCTRKRSQNDSLFDPVTKKSYCATCWQSWYTAEQERRNPAKGPLPPRSSHIASPPSTVETHALIPDDDSVGDLEGLTHTDGKLYLISRKRRLVFDAERTEDGLLRCVGDLRHDGHGADELRLYCVADTAEGRSFPFEPEAGDHCETPFDACEDLAPYLAFLAECMGKDRAALRIWDPYYCNGAVKRNFARLGFTSVHNQCDDFYRVLQESRAPEHDCIVTNPPYSTHPIDHAERLVKILCAQSKPWFVVQPNYVYTKPFWVHHTSTLLAAPRPFFLTPHNPRKYKYKTPSGLRDVASAQQLKTSPFVSMWYCWLGPKYAALLYHWIASAESAERTTLSLACSEYFLPDSFKDSSDKTRRKPRKLKRKALPPSIETHSVDVITSAKRKTKSKRSSEGLRNSRVAD